MPNGDESSRSLTECIQANAINSGQMHQPVADGLPAAIADCSLMATSSIVGQKAAFSDDQLYEFMVNPPSKEQTNHKIGFDTDCVFQQPNEVFVFSTEVANMATEAVLQGRYRSIIQFHKDNVANCASSAQQTFVNGTAFQLPRSHFGGQTLLSNSSSLRHPNGGSGRGFVQLQRQPSSNLANVAQWVQQQNAYQHQRHETSSFSSNVDYGFESKTNGMQCSQMPYSNPPQYWSTLSAPSTTGSNSGITVMSNNGDRVPNENLTMEQRQVREAKCAQLNQLRMLLFHQVPDDNHSAVDVEKRTAFTPQYIGQPANAGRTREGGHRPQYYARPTSTGLPQVQYRMAQPQGERYNAQQEYCDNKIFNQQMPVDSCCQTYCSQNTGQSNCNGYDVAESNSQYNVAVQSAPAHSTEVPPWNKLGPQRCLQHDENNQNSYGFQADGCEQRRGSGLMPYQQYKTYGGSVHPPASQVASCTDRAVVFDHIHMKADMGVPSTDPQLIDHVSPGKRKHSDSGVVEHETSSRLWNNGGPWQVSCAGHTSETSEQNKHLHSMPGFTSRLGTNKVSLSTCGMNIPSGSVAKMGLAGSSTMKKTQPTTASDTLKLNTCASSPSIPRSGVSAVSTLSSTPRSVSWSNMTSASLVSLMQNVESLPGSVRRNVVQGDVLRDKPLLGVTLDGLSSSDNTVFNSTNCLPSDLRFSTVQSSANGNCLGAVATSSQQLMSVAQDALYTTLNRNCAAKVMTVDQPSSKTDFAVSVHSTVRANSSVASVIVQSKAPNTISYHPNVLPMTPNTKTDSTEQKCGSSNYAGIVADVPKYSFSTCVNGADRGISTVKGAMFASQLHTRNTLMQEPQSNFACDSKSSSWLQNDCGSSQRHLAGCSTSVAPSLEVHSGKRSERVVASIDNMITRQSNGTVIQASLDAHPSVKGLRSGPLMRLAGGHMVETADCSVWRDGLGTTRLEQLNGIKQPSTP